MTGRESLAAALKLLSHEQLVELATAQILAAVGKPGLGAVESPTAALRAELATKPRAKRGGAPVAKAPRRTSKGVVAQKAARPGDVAEDIFAILAAAPDAMSVSQIAAKAKREPTSVGSALVRLKAAGRAFNAGRSVWGRWAVSQDIADEAVAALRGEA